MSTTPPLACTNRTVWVPEDQRITGPGLLPRSRPALIDRGGFHPIDVDIHQAAVVHLGVGQSNCSPVKLNWAVSPGEIEEVQGAVEGTRGR